MPFLPLGRGRRKERKMFRSLRLTKLPWVDEVQDQVGFRLPGRPGNRQPATPTPSQERHARAGNATSWHPRDLCRRASPTPAGPGPTCANRLTGKLYALPLHECVHTVATHTDAPEGRQSQSVRDRNSCRVTRPHRATESCEIIISISPVIILRKVQL